MLFGPTERSGFEHTFEHETRRFATPVWSSLDRVAPTRWVLLTTKAYQVDAAGCFLRRLARPDAGLAVVQNGVDHVDRVRPYWGTGTVLPVVISMPCSRSGPTAVLQRRKGTLTVPAGPDAEAFAGLFDERVNVTPTDDWTTNAWTKLLVNATLGMCALSMAPNGAILEPYMRPSAEAVLKEIIAVGRAAGAAFDDDDALVRSTFEKIGKTPEHRSSITQDREAGRPMEWDARNQVVVRTAERFGIDVPHNRALAGMLQAADGHRRG